MGLFYRSFRKPLKKCLCRKRRHSSWHKAVKRLKTYACAILKSTRIGRTIVDVIHKFKVPAVQQHRPLLEYGNGCNEELAHIYQTIMSHPMLNVSFRDVNISSFIFEEAPKKTARYYAGMLWNLKFHAIETVTQANHLNFIRRSLHMCIKYMDEKDFQILKTYLQIDKKERFKEIAILKDSASIKSYLWSTLTKSEQTLKKLVKTINNWFLCTPILVELAKLTSWTFLLENQACLLGVDELYAILLNASYNNTAHTSSMQSLYY